MIFTEYPNDFWHKREIYNFDPYNVLLAIATDIPVRLETGPQICYLQLQFLKKYTFKD